MCASVNFLLVKMCHSFNNIPKHNHTHTHARKHTCAHMLGVLAFYTDSFETCAHVCECACICLSLRTSLCEHVCVCSCACVCARSKIFPHPYPSSRRADSVGHKTRLCSYRPYSVVRRATSSIFCWNTRVYFLGLCCASYRTIKSSVFGLGNVRAHSDSHVSVGDPFSVSRCAIVTQPVCILCKISTRQSHMLFALAVCSAQWWHRFIC